MSKKEEPSNQSRRTESTPSSSQNNNRASIDNTNVFKQLFATLEAEHQKLHELEQRRLKLTEEMRNLREKLEQENRQLRSQSQEPAPKKNPTTTAAGATTTTTTTTAASSSGAATAKKSNLKKPDQVSALSTQMLKLNDGGALKTLANEMNVTFKDDIHSTSYVIDMPEIWLTPANSMNMQTLLGFEQQLDQDIDREIEQERQQEADQDNDQFLSDESDEEF